MRFLKEPLTQDVEPHKGLIHKSSTPSDALRSSRLVTAADAEFMRDCTLRILARDDITLAQKQSAIAGIRVAILGGA